MACDPLGDGQEKNGGVDWRAPYAGAADFQSNATECDFAIHKSAKSNFVG